MAQPTSTSSALLELRPRLSDLYDRSVDLFEADLKRSHSWCIGDHCRRIWQMLDANDRATIRATISHELRPLRGSVSDAWLDTYCIDAIKEHLLALGKFTTSVARWPRVARATERRRRRRTISAA